MCMMTEIVTIENYYDIVFTVIITLGTFTEYPYYKMLYEIKSNLGLPVPASHPEYVNINPELLIFDRWEKSHPARDKHRSRMEELLSR